MCRSRSCGTVEATVVLIVVLLAGSRVQAKYSGGTGEPNNPYQIATAADLIALGNEPNDYAKCFILTADIDLDPNLPGRKVFDRAVIAPDTNDSEFGFQGPAFTGEFDGRGHAITGLVIDSNLRFAGLFGMIGSGGRVCSLRLIGGSVRSQCLVTKSVVDGATGGLAGVSQGLATDCCHTGWVSSSGYVGGLVGCNYGAIRSCYNTGSADGEAYVGGLVGYNHGGVISACYNTGSVSSRAWYVGGLIGYSDHATISTCYSTGSVSGSGAVGGLVGSNYSGTISACFWDIQTSSQTSSVGGTGKTTGEMQAAKTFLDVGWDFVGETTNGTADIWWIDEGKDYPRLSWEGDGGTP
jgi:hypothetical protein